MTTHAQTAAREGIGRRPRAPRADERGIAGIALSGGLDAATKAHLEALAEPRRLGAGEVLCAQGAPADHVFSLASGVLKIYKSLAQGRRQISRFLHRGDFLGPAAEAECYGWTAQAVTAVELWRFERGPFAALVLVTPELEHRLLGMAWRELESAREHMLLLAQKGAEEKIASFLLWVAHLDDGRGKGEPLVLPMTRRDIAEYLGLKTETVSRTLRGMHRRGVINLPDPGHVALMHRQVLESLARGQRSMAAA